MERVYIGDPFIYTDGAAWYLTGSTRMSEGFEVFQSTDLTSWQPMGWLYRRRENCWADDAFWAPEVFTRGGLYYLTYSGRKAGTGQLLMALAVSENPAGPFVDRYAPWFDVGYSTIDGHIFEDRDRRLYLYFSRNGYDCEKKIAYGINYVAELKDDLSGLRGQPLKIGEADAPWETVLPHNRCNEGPTVIFHNGTYYLTYSANDTSDSHYGVGYMTAPHPLGPWTKAAENPILSTGGGLLAPGHNSLFKDRNGSMKMVYHSLNPKAPAAMENRFMNIADAIFMDGKLRVAVSKNPNSKKE